MADPHERLHIDGYLVSPELFTTGYARGDGPCECRSHCCARGAYIDLAERDLILAHAEQIKPHLDDSQSQDTAQWFEPGERADADYPSGRCVGTAVIGDKCALLDKRGRCSLQVAATASGTPKWTLKPLYCVLFPIEVSAGSIRFDPRLQNQRACCSVQEAFQVPLFEACREELVHLLGDAGYQTLEEHYAAHSDSVPPIGRAKHLPIYPAE